MNALEIQSLYKTYANGITALNGIDLTVKQGDFYALLGPNGAGKSTTIGIITTLVKKTSGDVKIFGYDINQNSFEAKARVGLVPQEFNFNVFQKVEQILITQAGYYGIAPKVAAERAGYFLEKLDLIDKRKQQARHLSGGQKRRLIIARALMHDPALLILDEPTAGVDIEIRRSMWQFLQELNQNGTTIILTTHYLEEAENLCKNIAIINHGKIIENTSMQDVLRKLHLETFIFYSDEPFQQLPEISSYQLRAIDSQSFEVDIQKGQNLNELFKHLTERGIKISSMKNKANRLEELFIRLTS